MSGGGRGGFEHTHRGGREKSSARYENTRFRIERGIRAAYGTVNHESSARNQHRTVGIDSVAASVYGYIAAGDNYIFLNRVVIARGVDSVVGGGCGYRSARDFDVAAFDSFVRIGNRYRAARDKSEPIGGYSVVERGKSKSSAFYYGVAAIDVKGVVGGVNRNYRVVIDNEDVFAFRNVDFVSVGVFVGDFADLYSLTALYESVERGRPSEIIARDLLIRVPALYISEIVVFEFVESLVGFGIGDEGAFGSYIGLSAVDNDYRVRLNSVARNGRRVNRVFQIYVALKLVGKSRNIVVAFGVKTVFGGGGYRKAFSISIFLAETA